MRIAVDYGCREEVLSYGDFVGGFSKGDRGEGSPPRYPHYAQFERRVDTPRPPRTPVTTPKMSSLMGPRRAVPWGNLHG